MIQMKLTNENQLQLLAFLRTAIGERKL